MEFFSKNICMKIIIYILSYYSCPGHRLWARVIKCVGFFCIIFPPNRAIVPMRPLHPSHALFPWQLKRRLEETKRPGFFKNAYRNVRKTWFDRRITQSEFSFETNILCNGRSVLWRTMKFGVRKRAFQNKLTLNW